MGITGTDLLKEITQELSDLGPSGIHNAFVPEDEVLQGASDEDEWEEVEQVIRRAGGAAAAGRHRAAGQQAGELPGGPAK